MTAPDLWIFGEVLFDTFPGGAAVLGGAPFNVAWNLTAFGAAPQLISAVGDDDAGQIIAERMESWGMSRRHLGAAAGYPTGKVTVQFVGGEPSYTIEEQQAYDNIPAAVLPERSQGWLYFGTLALRTAHNRKIFHALRQRHQGKLFADINLRQPFWSKDSVLALLDGLDWLKLNEKELALIAEGRDMEERARQLKTRFAFEGIVVTCGSQGAVAIGPDNALLEVRPDKPAAVADTVGAGDAFASVLLLGLLRSWPLAETLRRSQQFAAAVVGIQGAVSADPAFYQQHLQSWQ
ncbi:PfkB family carbohydrate kinase [Candidatus Electronema sp. JC]|uniref:PfkB family carbohydrate kinase n=1 Tax=Candidatus Electronema sp. JC TaxID=3401570 RepID=UPI003B437ABE